MSNLRSALPMHKLNFLDLGFYSIYDQLHLEEALLRTHDENWCIVSRGTPPAIVMGISGKAHELIHFEHTKKLGIPVIRRFSGGGTVIVDEETLFVTFICKSALHQETVFPEKIMRWSEAIYSRFLSPHTPFALRENDYIIGERKIGGNAQYIRKNNFLHHTSFLWDYDPTRMNCLLHPKKTPSYRGQREHSSFIDKLKNHLPSKEWFIENLKHSLAIDFDLINVTPEEAHKFVPQEFRKSTHYIELSTEII